MSLEDFDLTPLPAPRKDDVLFRPDKNHVLANACLNYTASSEPLYAEGYLIAARNLANQVLDTLQDQDILIFPIVYLYRHHVELVLKRLIVIGSFLVDHTLSDVEVRQLEKHRLDLLWNNFRPILRSVSKEAGWTPPSKEDIAGVTSYIRQLTEVDPEAQAFRYAVSKKGERSVPHLTHINIRVISEAMERLAYFLDGLEAAFVGLRDAKNEMVAEYERYY